jgi:hypothetical protein
MDNLQKVFEQFRESHLKLNPDKCQLFQKEARYLWHIVSLEEVIVDSEKLKVVREWQTPRNKHEVRSFLGQYTYCRRYISGFADTGKLLTRLTEEKQAVQWLPKVDAAFQSLREAAWTLPVLGCPQPGEQFIINTYMSNVGIGWVLSQVQDVQERAMR